MGELSPWHLLILAAVFVVLFGSRKLPDAARSLGKSMRIFKAETKALRDDDDDATRQAQAQQQTVQQQPAQPMAAQPVAPPQPLSPPPGDDTIVSGVPLAEAQRNQKST
jgi:sec-independent protein translocase protein TatA